MKRSTLCLLAALALAPLGCDNEPDQPQIKVTNPQGETTTIKLPDADKVKNDAEKAARDAREQAEEAADDAKDAAEDAADDAKDAANKAADEAKDAADAAEDAMK